EVMASCHRRAVLPGSRPGRVAPRSSARQNFLPMAQNGIYRKNDTQLLCHHALARLGYCFNRILQPSPPRKK
ncbi:hypothetical protein, partial [Azovibrio restrictus]|uniref:hypothetical protein n=1 Tax=Azovibrio restrictus TaxID=146938 RepID=UPI0026EBAD88